MSYSLQDSVKRRASFNAPIHHSYSLPRFPCRLHQTAILLQDHALPVGTAVTDTSLAGVFGREREVYVPVTSTIIGANAGDDDRDSSSSSDNRNSNSSSSNTNTNCGLSSSNNSNSKNSSSGGSSRAWLGQSLVLKLRQVNGDGVMSGVWCYCTES